MKIGILGTGDVGKALGKAFVALGHEVKLGSRDAKNDKALAWAQETGSKAGPRPGLMTTQPRTALVTGANRAG